MFTKSRCREADVLRGKWYATNAAKDKAKLQIHTRGCPVCREIMLDLTAQARAANMPELESEE